MAANGRRHQLVVYRYSLDRWWKSALGIAITLLALTAGLGFLPILPTGLPFLWVEDWVLWVAAGSGGFALLVALLLLVLRKTAYVQPCHNHLKVATPFLQFKISYRRIRQTTSAEMGRIFPPRRARGRKHALRRVLSAKTVILLDLNGWPMPRPLLQAFLSPLFFPDRSPRLALLVPDWIAFSNELESLRSAWFETIRRPTSTPQSDLLASIQNKSRR
jgi:hypothetical protein